MAFERSLDPADKPRDEVIERDNIDGILEN